MRFAEIRLRSLNQNSVLIFFRNQHSWQLWDFCCTQSGYSILEVLVQALPYILCKKKNRVGLSVHTALGSNVKRLWVAASVQKICLKCQNFLITISSNYSKNLGKISSKTFSQNWLSLWLFSWHLLEISDYPVVSKNISKI